MVIMRRSNMLTSQRPSEFIHVCDYIGQNKFVCTIPTQNSNIKLHSKPPFSRLLRHTWVKEVMQFYSYFTLLSNILSVVLLIPSKFPLKKEIRLCILFFEISDSKDFLHEK